MVPRGPFACNTEYSPRSGPGADQLGFAAAAESFNATFKRETLKGRKGWSNEREARLDAFRWLSRYNTRRQHSRLGQRSPIAYENTFHSTSTTLTRAA
ncbi:integrase core domain-containing protein [Streptomyces sp. NPDC059970]|uniref:integrase core domain-containing protein n=1 Tax=Streptomyces sp. NPDC059970 TaxID=3347019 RepID=UPI003678E19C